MVVENCVYARARWSRDVEFVQRSMFVATRTGTEDTGFRGMEGRSNDTLFQQRFEAASEKNMGVDAEGWPSA